MKEREVDGKVFLVNLELRRVSQALESGRWIATSSSQTCGVSRGESRASSNVPSPSPDRDTEIT